MADKTVKIRGEFDASGILASLKQIRSEMSKGGADSSLFKNVDKEFEKLSKLVQDFNVAKDKGFSSTKDADKFNKILNDIENSVLKVNHGLKDINKSSNFKINSSSIEKLTTEMLKAQDAVEDMKGAMLGIVNNSKNFSLKQMRTELAQAVEEGKDLQAIIEKTVKAQQSKSFASISAQFGDKGDAAFAGANVQFSAKIDTKNLDKYKQALTQMVLEGKSAKEAFDSFGKELSEEEQEYLKSSEGVEALQKDLQNLVKTAARAASINVGSVSAQMNKATSIGGFDIAGNFQYTSQSGQQIQQYIAEKQKATNLEYRYNAALEEQKRKAKELENTVNQSLNSQTAAAQQGINLQKAEIDATKQNIEAQERLDTAFSGLQTRLTQLLSIGTLYSEVRRIVRQTYNDVKELDKAFGEIAMVTDYSVQDLWAQYGNYAKMANELGQTTASVIQASGLFYQQGLDTAEALTLTEDTMKLATLAGLDFKDATSQMTAALRAFHMEMDEGSHITDVYAELAAHAAADVKGIATAMSKTASIANSAGMSFENTATFLTTMIEATQEAPDNIGTALKTVIARFTELKENVAGTADSAFDDLDYNKVDKALKSVGVALKDVNGQFRNLDDVFLELGQKWNTLDRNTQRYIATIAAGSRQQSRFIALMENYDRVVELQGVAENSEGRADEQFSKYADTVEYKINQLKNSWEQLRTSFLDSSMFKNAIEGLTGIVDKISKLKGTDLAAIGIWAMTIGKTIVSNIIKGIQGSANSIQKGIQNISKKITSKFSSQYFNIDLKIKANEKELNKLKLHLEALKKQEIILQTSIPDYNETYNKLINLANEIDAIQADGTINIDMVVNSSKFQGNNQDKQNARAILNQHNYTTNTERLIGENTAQAAALEQQALERGQAVGQALMVGISTAIMEVSNSEDGPEKAILTVLTTTIGSALPQIMNIGMQAGAAATGGFGAALKASLAAAGPALAIIAGIAAAIAGVVLAVKAWQYEQKKVFDEIEKNSAVSKLNKEIKELEENQEKLAEATQEANEAAKEEAEKYKNLTEAKESLDQYQNSFILTNEQQIAFRDLQNEIAEKFPEMIDHYNKQGDAILVMGNAWDEVIKKQEKAAAVSQRTAAEKALEESINQYQTNVDKQDELEETVKLIDQYKNSLDTLLSLSTTESFGVDSDFKDAIQILDDNFNLIKYHLGDLETQSISQEFASDISKTNDIINIIKEAFKAIEDTRFDNKKIEDVINTILDYSEGDQKDFQEKLQEGIDKLKSNDINYAKDIENSLKDINSKTNDVIIAHLTEKSTDYKNYSQNVQKIGAIMLQTNEDFEQFLDNYGTKYNLKGSALVQQGTAAYIKENTDKLATVDETLARNHDIIDEYYKKVDEKSLNISKRLTEISQISDEEVKRTLLKSEEQNINSYNQDIEALANHYHIMAEIIKDETTGIYTSNNKYIKEIETLSDSARQALTSLFSDSSVDATKFTKKLLDIKKELNLTSDELSSMMSIDWSQVNFSNISEFHDSIINKLKETMTSEDAKKVWKEFFALAQKTGSVNLISATMNTDSILESLDEKLTKKVAATSTLSNAIKDQMVDGFINFTDSEKVEKACEDLGLQVSDYLTYAADGTTIFDYEKLEHDLDAQRTSEAEALALAQQEYEAKRQELQYQELVLEAIDGTVNGTNAWYNSTVDVQKALHETAQLMADVGLITPEQIANISQYEAPEYKDTTSPTESAARQSIKEELKALDKWAEENLKIDSDFIKAYIAKMNAAYNEQIGNIEDAIQAGKDAVKSTEENAKKITDAQDKVAKALENVAEKQKELNEVLNGSPFDKHKLDSLYNYQTRLEQINKELSKVKENLDDLSSSDDINKLLSDYKSGVHTEAVTKRAENQVYNQAIAAQKKALTQDLGKEINAINKKYSAYGSQMSTNISDYFYQKDGRYYMQWDNINNSKLNKEFKDYIEESVDNMNKYQKAIEENEEDIAKRQKEIEKIEEDALNKRVELENKVVEVLKEKYQAEIDEAKNRNDAIEDANNEYLDALEKAIEKERKLRDKQNQWDDLAKKEKKLSLMQRDTSGAYRIETAKLENEIQSDREQLLDNSVDEIIDNLKELYDLQKESRDAEIEYQESLIDNATLIKEANAIIENWNGAEDAKEWFKNNIKEYSDWSEAQIKKEEKSWDDLYQAKVNYMEITQADLSNALETSATEITDTVTTTSQNLVTEVTNGVQTISDKVDEAIRKAVENLESAKKSLADAEKDLKDATDKVNEKANRYTGQNATTDSIGLVSSLGKAVAGVTKNKNVKQGELAYTPMQAAQSAIDKMKNGSVVQTASSNINNKTTSVKPIIDYTEYYKNKETSKNNSGNNNILKAKNIIQSFISDQTKDYRLSDVDIYSSKMQNLLSNLDDILNNSNGDYSINDLNKFLKDNKINYIFQKDAYSNNAILQYHKYAKGGLVNYTGPAWVDGTKSNPEAFLSADDTRRIAEFTRILEDLEFSMGHFSADTITNTNIGDTTIEVHINIENVASDYDVDQAVERVKQDIVKAAKYTGSNVILKQ